MKSLDLFCLGVVSLLGLSVPGCSSPLDGSHSSVGASADTTSDVRRICLQNGIDGLGGGDVVRVVGSDGSGNVSIQTLTGAAHTIPALSAAGQPTLCTLTPGPMQVCPADSTHTGAVTVLSTLSGTVGGTGTSAGTVARGTPLLLWDHVHDGDGKGASMALVMIGGQERFVAGSEVCLVGSYPSPSSVTTALQMQTTWQDPSTGETHSTQAAASVYRPRSPAMITRLVVHNTEATFASTMNLFTSGSAGTSAHVVLDRDGTLYRVVEDQYAAYHAGGNSMGNWNDATLGVEVVAYTASEGGGTDASFMTAAQGASLVNLLQAWMAQYNLQISPSTFQNSSSAPGYADLEYAGAALTIHRLTKANRGTDCPLHLWADSAAGDDAFFQWRLQTFGTFVTPGDAGAPATDSGSSTTDDAGAPAGDSGSSTTEDAGAPAPDSGSSSTGTSCKTDGDCNPGSDGSGQICVNGTCVAGCNADWECPGSTTCVGGQCQ
jgi:hypothetical protein